MDLGLDKLIEMFEDRFGRRASTALLIVVAFGVAAFSLHAIFAYLIRPAIDFGRDTTAFLNGAPFAPTKEQVAHWLIQAIATVIISVIAYAVVVALLHRLQRKLVRMQSDIEKIMANWDEIKSEMDRSALNAARTALNEAGIAPSNEPPETATTAILPNPP